MRHTAEVARADGDTHVHVIAEAGSNANGQVRLGRELITHAARAGADSVKFQIIYPEGLYRKGQYAFGHYDIRDVWRIREEGVLSDDGWRSLAEHAASEGIPFSASVFDRRGLDLLVSLNPPYVKIASCDLNNTRFLREVAERGIRMVVSTGMASLGDIERSVNVLARAGIEGERLVLLHCVSVYPARLDQVHVHFVRVLREAFGTAAGFSDHTTGSEAACMAVALGATWIEKHFTTDRTLPGLDHKHALEPEALRRYVDDIRAAELAMRPGVDKVSSDEAYTRQRARRGLYAAADLPPGHRIRPEDILVLRPEGPVAAHFADDLVGCVLRHGIEENGPFTWDAVERVD